MTTTLAPSDAPCSCGTDSATVPRDVVEQVRAELTKEPS